MSEKNATPADAEIILKLYDLRREATLREARRWLIFTFQPRSVEDFTAVISDMTSQENAYYRQVISYWEMAASMVLRGAVNADLYLDSQGEGLYILAKFHAFRDAIQAKTGRPFMRFTAELVEKYPAARDLYNRMLEGVQKQAAARKS
jgi:hypothetical protein